jgi:hypothetical protein
MFSISIGSIEERQARRVSPHDRSLWNKRTEREEAGREKVRQSLVEPGALITTSKWWVDGDLSRSNQPLYPSTAQPPSLENLFVLQRADQRMGKVPKNGEWRCSFLSRGAYLQIVQVAAICAVTVLILLLALAHDRNRRLDRRLGQGLEPELESVHWRERFVLAEDRLALSHLLLTG